MKKIGFLLLLCCLIFGTQVFAYSDWSQQFIDSFEKELTAKNPVEKDKYLDLLSSIINAPTVRRSTKPEIKLLVKDLKHWINLKKGISDADVSVKSSDGQNYQLLSNVDFDQVRQAWIDWHNELRASEGLEPYDYHSDLEKSAVKWADTLAQGGLRSGVHKRKDSDGYYNYGSIKDWFGEIGIFFEKESGGRSAFSESVGYRMLQCSSDCTDEVINVSKKIFDAFAHEGKNGPHYKAIMMPHFKQIGLGFQLDDKQRTLYAVIHYAGDIVD